MIIISNRIIRGYLFSAVDKTAIILDLRENRIIHIVFSDAYSFHQLSNKIKYTNAFAILYTYFHNVETTYFMLIGNIFPSNVDDFKYLPEECRKNIYLLCILYSTRHKFPGNIMNTIPPEIFRQILQKYAETFYNRQIGPIK